MIVLSVNSISKYYGIDTVLKDVSLSLQEGERLGIVGANGAGKTTLLRLISGALQADEGSVSLSERCDMDYLRQQGETLFTGTCYDELKAVFDGVFRIEARIREIEVLMGDAHENDPLQYRRLSEEYSRLMDRFEESNGYGYESAIMGVFRGLGFRQEDITRDAASLSGGEQARLSLCRILLRKPSLMLLDEPTNHLDISSIAWLESYLSSYRGSVIVVSHDRYFLDAVCTRIGEISFNSLMCFDGNYTSYVQQKEELRQRMQKEYELNRREITRQEEIIATYKRFNREKSIKAARSREKALARIERVERPKDEKKIHFSFDVTRKTGTDILIAEDISFSYGTEPLFKNISLHLRASERMAIVGRNGIGKSTLLKVLNSQLKPDTGSFLWGTGVEIGYYDQKMENLNPENTAFDEVWDSYPSLHPQKVRDTLGQFLFSGDDIEKKIGELSGGEKARITMIKLLLGKYNVLLLDEPTNHLDSESCRVLENALNSFNGTFIFVSHDRYFINRVATRILEMRDDGVTDYEGNWDEYNHHKMLEAREDPFGANSGVTKTELRKQARSAKEQEARIREKKRAVKQAEDNVGALEAHMKELERLLSSPASAEESHKLSEQYAAAEEALTKALAQWEAVTATLEEDRDNDA